MELSRFKEIKRCIKCDFFTENIQRIHCKGNRNSTEICADITYEHMHLTCKGCGFEMLEHTKDSNVV